MNTQTTGCAQTQCTQTSCGHQNNHSCNYIIIIVLYILLAIILGSCFF